MPSLLIPESEPDRNDPVRWGTRFGGRPLSTRDDFAWPACRSCDGNMQFLGQIQPEGSPDLLLLFMCQNDPGVCNEWDADGGANAVVAMAPGHAVDVCPPASGLTERGTQYGAKIVSAPGADYEAARIAWTNESDVPRPVLGQVGGAPYWLQGDETPVCDSCQTCMEFVAQLEEGPDERTSMNFGGGGTAYIFRCASCSSNAKFLFQC